MPGCFSRLSNKFSKKKKGEKDRQGGLPPDSAPNGKSNTLSAPESGQPDCAAPVKESPGKEGPKDRWLEAFNSLPEEEQKDLKAMGFDNLKSGPTTVADLVSTVEKKQEECQDKFWKVKAGGKEIVFREYTESIVGWLTKAGDIAVQFAPPQASLPWGLVKNLMNIPVNESAQMGALLLTTEVVVSITSRGQVYEEIYLAQAGEGAIVAVQERLEKSLVNLYKTSLELLASSNKLLSSGTGRNIIEAIVNPGKATDNLAALGGQEDALLKDVQTCEVSRSSTADKRSNEMLEMLQAPMARVDAGVSQLLSHVNEQERIAMLEWISPIQFGMQHDNFRENRTPGTGEWLVEHEDFDRWKDKPSSVLFWLQGDPGSGKSYLTSKVIDTMRDRISYPLKNEGFAFFYCKRDDKPSRNQPLDILQSLVRQLSTTARNPESMQTNLHKMCKEAREKGTNFRLEQCKEQILASIDIYQKTTLVIDAMDECDPETRHELVDALELFLKSSKKPVKIFISSRPDTTLENQLKSSPSVGIQASDNQGDIEKFIHVELDRLVTATPFLEKLKPEIVAKLLERSQGMFQWVSLQLTRIGKSNRPAKVRTCLDTLPGSLKEAYDQVWREIETQEELADQTLIKRAFLWVSSACKPMTSDELLWAVRVSPTEGPLSLEDEIDEQGLLSLCHNLLIIDSQFKVWRFAHLSVREYIEKEKGWTLPQANLHTASVSLLLLSNTYEKVDPDTVSDPSGQPPNLDDLFDLSHPFQIYTRHHWALHIRALGQAEEMILAPILKAFLGSPEESSWQYRRWHTLIQNDRNQPSTSMFDHFSGSRKSDISPAHIPIFAMCRFGFDSILWDWWESTEISLASMSESGLCLLSLAALAGSMPICNLLVKRGMDVNRRLTKSSYYGSPLAAAAGTGQTEVVKFLVLEGGAEVNAQLENPNYGSVLAIAAAEGHVEVVKFLVREAKADVNLPLPYPYGQYGSALVAACKAEDIEICKVLVQEGKANVNMQFETGSDGSAIAAAAFMAPIEVVKYLVREGGADVHVPVTIGRHGSVIEKAAARDRFDVVKFLVEEAAVDVNTPSQAGNWGSPLAAAAVHNRDDIARYLILEAGADVDMPLPHGPYGTALMAAAKGGTTEIFMLFLENSKAGVHTQLPYGNYGSVLVAAAPRRNFEILKWLIQEKGVDVNAPLEHGEYGSALAAAASERYSIECVKYLTQEAGADVNKQLFHGEYGSALAVAASSWMTFETVKYLIHEAGADVNMQLQTGEFGSVLARVIQSDSLKTVKFLVQEGGANVDMPLARGFFGSALATAAAIADGDLAMVKFLVEEGKANVNLPLQNGKFGSALTTAVVGEEIEVVKYLIESKADVNQRLPDGKRGSALAAAASLGEKEAADILINAGAEVNLKLEGAPFGSALQAALADISDEDRMFLELRGDSEESLKEKKAEIAELLRRHGATF